jgi:hypothetical protein
MDKKSDEEKFQFCISVFLEAKLYEKRDMTKEQYISKCRELWGKLEVNEEYEDKIIVDKLMPMRDLVKKNNYDYYDKLFQNEKPLDDEPERPSLYCTAIGMYDKDGNLLKKNPDGTHQSNTDNDSLFSETAEPKPMPLIIGFFDVLGFSKKLKDLGIDKIFKIYEQLIQKTVLKDSWRCLGRAKVGPRRYSPIVFNLPVRYSYFSDTILLWVPLVQYFVAPFTVRCAHLICEALKDGMPLRGSITIGEAVMHKKTSTYIGEPLVEAAALEKVQAWIGASFGQSATWPEFQEELDPKLIFQYYTKHFKPGNEKLVSNLVLDWPRQWRSKFNGSAIDKLNELNNFKEYEHYYLNTIDFVRYSESNENWWKKYFKNSV